MSNIKDSLTQSTYINISKVLTSEIGMKKAFFLTLYINEAERVQEEWFQLKRADIEESWGMSPLIQRNITNQLVVEGLLHIKKEGMPRVNYYKVDFRKIEEILTEATPRYIEECRRRDEEYHKEFLRDQERLAKQKSKQQSQNEL